jgi:asparagine synthase (glutamine-hydrolysing)
LREIDISTYLVDNILVKVDRAAMSCGLETRAPFLDRRIAELSASADRSWLSDTEQKHVLKETLSKYVSSDIFRRTKMGFGAPVGEWLRTTLRPWASNLIQSFDWESTGISSSYVHELWDEHLLSSDKSATYLWILLSLASSVERYR